MCNCKRLQIHNSLLKKNPSWLKKLTEIMCLSIIALLYIINTLILQCGGLNVDKFPIREQNLMSYISNNPRYMRPFRSILRNSSNAEHGKPQENQTTLDTQANLDKLQQERDNTLKRKIATLVNQTIHDSGIKIESTQYLKDKYESQIHYKVGSFVSMIKKSRDMMNELFHIAVKHKDDWNTLEEMKIFELIVNTNVETTNLVNQLVELHSTKDNNNTTKI